MQKFSSLTWQILRKIMDPFVAKQLDQIASLFQSFSPETIAPAHTQNGYYDNGSIDECYIHGRNSPIGTSLSVGSGHNNSDLNHSATTKSQTPNLTTDYSETKGSVMLSRNVSRSNKSVDREMTPKRENGVVRRQSFNDRRSSNDVSR